MRMGKGEEREIRCGMGEQIGEKGLSLSLSLSLLLRLEERVFLSLSLTCCLLSFVYQPVWLRVPFAFVPPTLPDNPFES